MKGNGLCHGITGNGYMFHCLYRLFKKLIQEYENKQKTEMEIDTTVESDKESDIPNECRLYDDELKFLKK